jgi:hypothetical protein
MVYGDNGYSVSNFYRCVFLGTGRSTTFFHTLDNYIHLTECYFNADFIDANISIDSAWSNVMHNCHLDIDVTAPIGGGNHYIMGHYNFGGMGGAATSFIDVKFNGFTSQVTVTQETYPNCYGIASNFIAGVSYDYSLKGMVLLTDEQALTRSNYPQLDFDLIWTNTDGVTKPRLASLPALEVIHNYIDDYIRVYIETVGPNTFINADNESVEFTHSKAIASHSHVVCYASMDPDTLVDPANIVDYVMDSSTTSHFIAPCSDEGRWYVRVVYDDGISTDYIDYNFLHYHMRAQIIDIPVGNFKIWNDVGENSALIHGMVHHNGYVYGSSRAGGLNSTNRSIVKIKADDYSEYSYVIMFRNKIAQTGFLNVIEQIVYCQGFLWVWICGTGQSYTGTLARINLDDLDYILFNPLAGYVSSGPPIGTDGTYLFLCDEHNYLKIDTSLLLGSFASYGYDGSAVVLLPSAARLASLAWYNKDNPVLVDLPLAHAHVAYVHSVCADSRHVYFVHSTVTADSLGGYDPESGTNICFVNKVNKSTWTSEGTVTTPQCTDDMCQDDNYIYLSPEELRYPAQLGFTWGLVAIRKSDLFIRPLCSLHLLFHEKATYQLDRSGYGVQLLGQYLAVQLINSRQTVVISRENVDQWDINKPVGYATIALFGFTLDGVAVSAPLNEMVRDSNQWFHASIWASPSTFLKYQLPGFEDPLPPVVETILINTFIDETTLGGYVVDAGSSVVTENGFYWGTDPTNLVTQIIVAGITQAFQDVVSPAPGLYFFKAYATNDVGTGYGQVVPFVVGNTVVMSHDNDDAVVEYNDEACGQAVRCCKPAPGVATGTVGSVTDVDGVVYPTVVINEIEWMVKNVRIKKYSNLDAIPEVTDPNIWSGLTTGARCFYDNNTKN